MGLKLGDFLISLIFFLVPSVSPNHARFSVRQFTDAMMKEMYLNWLKYTEGLKSLFTSQTGKDHLKDRRYRA
jgi:hypothetical protein